MKRLDNELVERKFFKTRSKAAQAIKSGIIYCDGKQITKCGFEVMPTMKIEVRGEVLPYVSRGGLKLEKAIQIWKMNLSQKVMIDIGSSTGGFSDCAIQNGIQKIYAIDVGSNQFDLELAKNPKISLMEKTDFRKIEKKKIEDADFATIDVSFISVTKLIEKIKELTNLKEIVCLIKPQFECGKELADEYKGILLNSKIHQEIILRVIQAFDKISFYCYGITASPIRGGDGNIEYLAYLKKQKENFSESQISKDKIEKVVGEAFQKIN